MIDTVFGIKVRKSGLCINRYRPIIGRLLDADYRLANNRPLPYQCILYIILWWCAQQRLAGCWTGFISDNYTQLSPLQGGPN